MPPPTSFTNEQKTFALDQIRALISTLSVHELELIADLDESRAYEEDGASDIVDWLTYRYGTSRRTEQHKVQLAREVNRLPHVKMAVAEGRISWDKMRALASFVTPEDDETWAARAEVASYRDVRNAAAEARRREQLAERDKAESEVHLIKDYELGAHDISGHLVGSDGEIVATALKQIALSFGRNENGAWDPLSKNLAQALVMLAKTHLGKHPRSDSALVTIHVTEDAFRSSDGLAQYESGLIVDAEEAREFACDGYVQTVIHDPNGVVIEVGKRVRTLPPATKRELIRRDICCVLCGGESFLQAHHVHHWEHGGDHKLKNLTLLCWRCHTARTNGSGASRATNTVRCC